MNLQFTEKEFPIQMVWAIKTTGWLFFLVLFVVAGGENDKSIAYLVVGLVLFVITVLKKITFHFSLGNDFLDLKQGILSRQERHIPYGVIQNIFVKQDLFDRLFGIASLVLENAAYGGINPEQQKIFGHSINSGKARGPEMVGFSGNTVSIPGLKKDDAEKLKTLLLQKMKDHPIDDSQSGL